MLRELCERMACDQLDKPFWVRQYFISPVTQTTEGSGTDCCIQYKIHISTPKQEPENPAASGEMVQVFWSPGPPSFPLFPKVRIAVTSLVHSVCPIMKSSTANEPGAVCHHPLQSHSHEAVFFFSLQAVRAVATEQPVHFDDWQREMEPEEVEHLEDKQHVAGDGAKEAALGSDSKCDDRAAIGQEVAERTKEKDDQSMADMGLPFLTGISPAGFLSANPKQPGDQDHAVKVNV